MKMALSKSLFLLFGLITFSGLSHANSDLHHQIKQLDKAFFDAFNQCDIDAMAAMMSKELEFYHDIAGLGDYEGNLAATKNLCERNLGLVRTLVPETLEVYPVKDFGAIQLGKHTFCHEVNGKDDCGTFGFTHVWKQTESGWVVHRVMSYGH